jgi:hypothetical protein
MFHCQARLPESLMKSQAPPPPKTAFWTSPNHGTVARERGRQRCGSNDISPEFQGNFPFLTLSRDHQSWDLWMWLMGYARHNRFWSIPTCEVIVTLHHLTQVPEKNLWSRTDTHGMVTCKRLWKANHVSDSAESQNSLWVQASQTHAL